MTKRQALALADLLTRRPGWHETRLRNVPAHIGSFGVRVEAHLYVLIDMERPSVHHPPQGRPEAFEIYPSGRVVDPFAVAP